MKRNLLKVLLAIISLLALSVGLVGCDGYSNGGGDGDSHTCDYNEHGICNECDAGASIGLEYNRIGYNKYACVGFGNCEDNEIKIPSRYKGIPVTMVGDELGNTMFDDYLDEYTITSIVIPSSVTTIGAQIRFMRDLTNITMPNSLENLSDFNIYDCPSINYNIKDGLKYLGNQDNPYLYLAGAVSTSISYANIDGNCKFIGESAFADCALLTNVKIPNSVKQIIAHGFCVNAFEGCDSLYYNIKNGLRYLGNEENPYLWLVGAESKNITSANITNGCKYIAQCCFSTYWHGGSSTGDGYQNLTEVTIPSSVESFAEDAFACENLERINYSGTLKQWVSIDFGDYWANSVDSMDFYVNGERITSLNLDDSFEKINAWAFYKFNMITSVRFSGTVEEYNDINFGKFWAPDSHELYINNNLVEEITLTSNNSIYGVKDCSSIKTINIEGEVDSIGHDAFSYHPSLEKVTIGNSVKYIGEDAFYNCKSLKTLTIGNGLEFIGDYAFDSCSSLDKVNFLGTVDEWVQIEFYDKDSNPLYNNVMFYINDTLITVANITTATKISSYAFYNCASLESITIGNSVTSIGENAFNNCTSLTSVIIPNSVTSIENETFRRCTSLTSVIIPNSITNIGDEAFYGCESLESIVIPNSVTSIGSYVFNNCTSLTSVIIPNSVISIGYRAFYGCNSITTIYCEAESQPSDWESGWNNRYSSNTHSIVWGYTGE